MVVWGESPYSAISRTSLSRSCIDLVMISCSSLLKRFKKTMISEEGTLGKKKESQTLVWSRSEALLAKSSSWANEFPTIMNRTILLTYSCSFRANWLRYDKRVWDGQFEHLGLLDGLPSTPSAYRGRLGFLIEIQLQVRSSKQHISVS